MSEKTPRRRSAPKPPPKRVPGGASDPAETSRPFPIVGVGASAGGLEAFSQLLRALPVDTGMAFVLVQHLDPTHESRLTDVLCGPPHEADDHSLATVTRTGSYDDAFAAVSGFLDTEYEAGPR